MKRAMGFTIVTVLLLGSTIKGPNINNLYAEDMYNLRAYEFDPNPLNRRVWKMSLEEHPNFTISKLMGKNLVDFMGPAICAQVTPNNKVVYIKGHAEGVRTIIANPSEWNFTARYQGPVVVTGQHPDRWGFSYITATRKKQKTAAVRRFSSGGRFAPKYNGNRQ